MKKLFIFLVVLLPLSCLAQYTISGRVLSKADNKPVQNASVFLSHATIGDKTAADGTFTLHNVNPGKYELIVSIIGFQSYDQSITVSNSNLQFADITIAPKIISLQEVVVKPDANRPRNFEWFKEQFIGTSDLARECKILNPEILNLDYDEATSTLTASTTDFLVIENPELGYKIKYLLTNFSFVNKDNINGKVLYEGSVLYEEMKGTAAQERGWRDKRQQIYANSEMHFLRAALGNRLEQEGFSVQRLAIYANPERPSDSLIEAKTNYYKQLKKGADKRADSLSYWIKKSKLPKTIQKLIHLPLNNDDFLLQTDKPGLFALGCDFDGLYVTYNKGHHFSATGQLGYVNTLRNTENTLINFNAPYAFFYDNGVIINPYSLLFYGVWARNRIAELLPINYYAVPDDQNIQNPVDSTIAKNITTKLKTYAINHTTEKVYLHFDKPYYAAGDTMYFKAYLTAGDSNKLSGISGVLHVDLVNSANKVDQSIKLQVTDGVAWGDFALPDSLPQENYRVRAYTRWMLNAGDDSHFDQTIPIGSIRTNKIPESIANHPQIQNKPDIQFFPEGGRLVSGIRSKIAFKAIGSNGLGVDFKGEIIDNDNKQVTSFASAHLGMGYFYFEPAEGKTYKAKITYPDGSQDLSDLPAADSQGIALSVNNDSQSKVSVTVAASKTFYQYNKDKNYTLVIYSAGAASTHICKLDSQVVNLDISKWTLHTGIAAVTLFSPNGEPLSERLIFIQNNDQLNIHVSSDKNVWAQREKTSLKFNVKNSAGELSAGHFSVAVIDESKVPVNENSENTILTDLLLTANLKGFVEQPNYYFTNITDKTNADLDLVMLTHGYRSFEWRKVLNNENPVAAYQPENGLEIGGTVKSLNEKPLTDGTVTMLSMNGGPVRSSGIDQNGAFRFSNLTFMDSSHFVLRAKNEKLKNKTNIFYTADQPLSVKSNKTPLMDQDDINKLMAAYFGNIKAQLGEIAKYGSAKGIMLKQVNIRNAKKDDDYPSSNIAGPGAADQVIHRKDFQGSGLFSSYFQGRLIGVIFRPPPNDPGGLNYAYLTTPISLNTNGNPPMLLIVDGVKIPGYEMSPDEINVDDVETVEVLRYTSATIYGSTAGAGVLIITTRRGAGEPGSKGTPLGILPISPKGFYKAREFYVPKYDHKENNFNRKDLRSTIYWSPELIPDKDGNVSVDYFNADGAGNYRVVIEGIDDKGNLGRQVYRYKVE